MNKKRGRNQSYSLTKGQAEVDHARLVINHNRLKAEQQRKNQEALMKDLERYKEYLKNEENKKELNPPPTPREEAIINTRKGYGRPQFYWWEDLENGKFCYTTIEGPDSNEDDDPQTYCYTEYDLIKKMNKDNGFFRKNQEYDDDEDDDYD